MTDFEKKEIRKTFERYSLRTCYKQVRYMIDCAEVSDDLQERRDWIECYNIGMDVIDKKLSKYK